MGIHQCGSVSSLPCTHQRQTCACCLRPRVGRTVRLHANRFGFEFRRKFGQQRVQHLVRHLCPSCVRACGGWVGGCDWCEVAASRPTFLHARVNITSTGLNASTECAWPDTHAEGAETRSGRRHRAQIAQQRLSLRMSYLFHLCIRMIE